MAVTKPEFYIARETLERLIENAERARDLFVSQKLFELADHTDDQLQAFRELHETNYGRK
jgi:hypothetical protein